MFMEGAITIIRAYAQLFSTLENSRCHSKGVTRYRCVDSHGVVQEGEEELPPAASLRIRLSVRTISDLKCVLSYYHEKYTIQHNLFSRCFFFSNKVSTLLQNKRSLGQIVVQLHSCNEYNVELGVWWGRNQSFATKPPSGITAAKYSTLVTNVTRIIVL